MAQLDRYKESLAAPNEAEKPTISSALVVSLHSSSGRFSAEVTNQVKRCPKRYDILEKEQAYEAHVAHSVNPGNGYDRAWGRDHHCAGYKKHQRCDQPTDDTGCRFQITSDHENRRRDLCHADNVRTDVGTE